MAEANFRVVRTHGGAFEAPQIKIEGTEVDPIVSKVMAGSPAVHIAKTVEYTEHGIFVHYKGLKYPKKGLPDSELIVCTDIAKRMTMMLFGIFSDKSLGLSYLGFAILPWKIKKKILQNALSKYIRALDYILSPAYFKPQLYTDCGKEVRKLITIFICELGFPLELADTLGKIGATIIQHDDAYRFRIEDIASCVNPADFARNPRKELTRLIEIYCARETYEGVRQKVGGPIKMMNLALLHPKIKRAFRKAIKAVNFEKMGLDDADRYHCLLMGVYNYMGIPIEERFRRYEFIHKDTGMPPMININQS